jgi:hypothetical protein
MGNARINASLRLVPGAMPALETACEFLFSLFPFLLALPVFSSLLLIPRRDCGRCQLFSVVAWGIAGSTCLLVRLSNYARLHWALWGIWLYIGLAASALVLEVVTLAAGKWSS